MSHATQSMSIEDTWSRNYDRFAAAVHRSASLTPPKARLYRTTATDLFDDYLSAFDSDPGQRQYLNCSCCRTFLNHFGGLVYIDDAGNTVPWAFNGNAATPGMGDAYADAARKIEAKIRAAKITRPFYSRAVMLGWRERGGYSHLCAAVHAVHTSRTMTPGQQAAEEKQQFNSLTRALLETPTNVFDHAASLLTVANLAQTKFAGHAGALATLSARFQSANGQTRRDALVWKAMEIGGSGFAHVRGAAIGTLLDDLKNGVPDQDAMRKFSSIVDPMAYMRTTSAPKAGNIKRAEDLIAKLGLAPALERSVAPFANVPLTWYPASVPAVDEVAPKAKGKPALGTVFAHLHGPAASSPSSDVAGRAMTWDQFSRKVLPTATCIELIEPGENTFGAVTAPTNPDAPAIFAWDTPDARNPYSWYRWNAIEAADFGVQGRTALRGISTLPCAWFKSGAPAHDGVILYLQGAADARLDAAGLGLFPELLSQDLREVRSTIMHHSMAGRLTPTADGAFGLVLRRGFCRAKLRVTSRGSAVAVTYDVKGWD